MAFSGSSIKVFTLETDPPLSSTFHGMAEAQVMAVCLPEDQNNAMFIAEWPEDKYSHHTVPQAIPKASSYKSLIMKKAYHAGEIHNETSSWDYHCFYSEIQQQKVHADLAVMGPVDQTRKESTTYNSLKSCSEYFLQNSVQNSHRDFAEIKQTHELQNVGENFEADHFKSGLSCHQKERAACGFVALQKKDIHTSLSQLFLNEGAHEIEVGTEDAMDSFLETEAQLKTTKFRFHEDERQSMEISKKTDEMGSDSPHSVSLLFQSEEFSLSDYQYLLGCDPPHLAEERGETTESSAKENISPGKNAQQNVMTPTSKINNQPFLIKGHEPKIFDTSVKRPEDKPWKTQIHRSVIEPSVEVLKRDDVVFEELPIVVSPYFPNKDNHPVQQGQRKSLHDRSSEAHFNSKVLKLSPENMNTISKITDYENADDEYQICRKFFTPRLHSKRPQPVEELKESESKVPHKTSRLNTKSKNDCQKITNYFPVVKSKTRDHRMFAEFQSHRAKTSNTADVGRSMSKFEFDDLPSRTPKKMSNYFFPKPPKRKCLDSSSISKNKTSKIEHLGEDNSKIDPVHEKLPLEMEDMVSNMEEKEGTVLLRKMEDDSQVLELKENEVESFARTLESGGELIEIGFTICYREHYSLLNYPETTTRTVCLPIGVMTRIEFASGAVFLCFQDNNELQRESSRSLLRCLLETQCDKVCYEAQAFIEFVMDVMKEADVKISYHWNLLDPKIGIWLIDPDHPPNSFQNVLETFNLTVNGLDGSADWKETVAKYLAAQSKSKRKLYDTLTSLSLWDVFYNMETPLVPILAAMEQRRLKLNCDQLQEISNLLKEKMTTLEHKAWKLVGKQFSMTSPVQLRKILYDQLKLDELGAVQIKSTASLGAKSTDEGTLKKLEKLHPLPGLILEFRHALKIKSTYLDGILSNVEDQTYIRTTWEQCAAATGRITSSNPNLQSIPKRNEAFDVQGESFNLRKLFISRQCHVFIAADFQQIELRTFAQLSNDQKLISALKQPQDIFWTMTKIRLGNDNFDASEREKTKLLMYALLYGAGANKISELLSIDVASAQKISSDFSLLFPALKTYRSRILQDCRQNKELRSLSGRRRVFPSISATEVQLKHYTERQAFNFVIQGSAADICKAAMLRVECALMNQDFQTSLLMQIHDELLWEVEEKHEAAAKVVITKSIEESMCYWQEKFNLEVPMPVKISSGRTWGQMT